MKKFRFSIPILIIFILVFTYLPPVHSLQIDTSEGILIDPLDTSINIENSMSSGYTIENGSVRIDFGERHYLYDANSYANSSWVFYRDNIQPFFIINALIGLKILFEVPIENSTYYALRYIDGINFTTNSTYSMLVPIQHFKFHIDQCRENVSSIVFKWVGNFNSEKIRIFAWDYSANNGKGRWVFQGERYDKDITILIGSGSAKDYVNKDGYVEIVITPWLSSSNSTSLQTDYISLEVNEVVRKEADIITKIIHPDRLWRWECVRWSGNVSRDTSIRLQILDKNGNPLDDSILYGNSDGFTDKEIPLVDIGYIEYIRLKFILRTKNPSTSPSLDRYSILWQSENKVWKDNLSNYYRLEKKSDSEVISKIVYLPRGFWWKNFYAKVNLSGGGKVTFSILDSNSKVIVDHIPGRELTEYNISGICANKIILKAKIEKNGTFVPQVDEWWITFSSENSKPIFRYPSVIYINKRDMEKKIVDIKVYTRDDFPGICENSAKYRLRYRDNLTYLTYTTDWIPASVSGKRSCNTGWTEILANNIHLFFDDSLKNLLKLKERKNITLSSIQFRVSDISGNVGYTDFIDVEKDVDPPHSWIETKVEDVGFKHGSEGIDISADAVDDISNIRSITLYYRYSSDNETYSDPIEYATSNVTPCEWNFIPDGSGYYRLFTIATDTAGNSENIKDGDITLLIDINKPYRPQFENRIYWRNNRTINFVYFSDDFKIDSIEYRIGGEEYFEWRCIAKNVNSSIYSSEWDIDPWDWDAMENGKVYPIYFRVRDVVGNTYTTPNDGEALRIGKDSTAPFPSIEPIKMWQWKIPLEISCYLSSENGSEISKVELLYRYSLDNKNWNEWKEYNSTKFVGWHTWKFSPPDGNGYYELRVMAYDLAGNVGMSSITEFGLTVFPEVEMVMLISTFILMIILFAFITRKWD